MKNLILLGLTVILFTACQKQEVRFTTASTNIDVVKKLLSDYHAGNWDAWKTNYADTAKIFHNNWKTGATPVETAESLKEILSNTFSYHFDEGEDDIFYEQTIDDDGKTWVNFWGNWKGTLTANGQELEIPVHLSCQMANGKIVREYGFYDISNFVLALQEIEASSKTTEAPSKKAEAPSEKAEEASKETEVSSLEGAEITEPAIIIEKEIIIIETVADTPVIYPGCSGTFPEIRACSIQNFVSFISKNFDSDIASDRNLREGEYKIRALVKIDKTGKASILKVDAPNTTLEKEVVRIINKLPNMTAATKNGKPIDVSFVLPVDFTVE